MTEGWLDRRIIECWRNPMGTKVFAGLKVKVFVRMRVEFADYRHGEDKRRCGSKLAASDQRNFATESLTDLPLQYSTRNNDCRAQENRIPE